MVKACKNKIAIIGGGASGCICTYFLLQLGLDVVIFEKGMLRAIGKLTDVLHGVCYGELFFRLRHLVYLQQQL